MRIHTLALSFTLFCGTAALAGDAAPLDGTNFTVKVGEVGKPLDTPHILRFSAGYMSSPECSEWGFGKGAYRAKLGDGRVTFEVTLPSAKEGTLHWKGVVEKDTIRGDSVWTKDGQKPIRYRFEGHRKK